jgi:branched-chain amino acid transport system ATP-binding protein
MDETAPYRPLLLRAVGVTKQFGSLVALDGIDFDVPRHAIVSLIGPNGAGKTIFFNILSGIHKPDSGAAWFDGQRLLGRPPHAIAALGIARTFQTSRVFANMTVLENVLVGLHSRLHAGIWAAILRTAAVRQEEDAATARARQLLAVTGLSAAAGALAKNLPYGDQRRLEVARALAGDPQLLMLDEPTAGMNPQETATMMALIARLRYEHGLTILLIEHDMRVVMRISDRVTVLNYGVKIAEGTPDEVRADRRVVEAYLGQGIAAGVPVGSVHREG